MQDGGWKTNWHMPYPVILKNYHKFNLQVEMLWLLICTLELICESFNILMKITKQTIATDFSIVGIHRNW